MLRLFLSLYLAICLGLVIINLSSNFLYEHLQSQYFQDKDNELNNLSQLAQAFKTLTPEQIKQIQKSIPYSSQLINPGDLHLLQHQQTQLQNGQVIALFNADQNVNLYVETANHQLLKIGPIPLSNTSQQLADGIIFLSYLTLAIFILAWSRPLWRDLSALKTMAEQIKQGQFKTSSSVNKQSVIYPVVTSFNVMATKIEELISSQKQMTHAISHDIKTPLARLKFSLAILKTQPELLTKTSTDMLQDVEEIDQLTSELLTYARLENKQTLNIEQVDLVQLVNNTAEKLRRNSPIILTVNCKEPTLFYCDGHLIERCLQNLITNGFKYAINQVVVTISASDSRLVLTVEDDGIGIEEQDRQTVLNPFNRLEDDTTKLTGGFGLGLAIVNKIVIWHCGELRIARSSLGGALIEIIIPRQEKQLTASE